VKGENRVWEKCAFGAPAAKPELHQAILLCEDPGSFDNVSPTMANECDEEGYTPLHLACKMNLENWVHALIRSKADVNMCTLPRKIGVRAYTTYEFGGNNALHLAFEAKSEGIMKALLEAKANPLAKNDADLLPYHMALVSKPMPDKKWFEFKPEEAKDPVMHWDRKEIA